MFLWIKHVCRNFSVGFKSYTIPIQILWIKGGLKEYFILEKKRSRLKSPIRQKKMKFWRILQFLKLKYLLDPNALKVFDTSFFLKTEVFIEYFKITLKSSGALVALSYYCRMVAILKMQYLCCCSDHATEAGRQVASVVNPQIKDTQYLISVKVIRYLPTHSSTLHLGCIF
jgi:hypothetical protein